MEAKTALPSQGLRGDCGKDKSHCYPSEHQAYPAARSTPSSGWEHPLSPGRSCSQPRAPGPRGWNSPAGPDLGNFSNHEASLWSRPGHGHPGRPLHPWWFPGPREPPDCAGCPPRVVSPLTLFHHLQQTLLDELLPALPAGHLLLQRCTTQTSR